MIEEILGESRDLPPVSSAASDSYDRATDRLLELVDNRLRTHPNINALSGHNPFALLKDIHRKHAGLMSAALQTRSYELLAKALPWMYRAYHARGFSFDYFLAELEAWRWAITEALDKPYEQADLQAVYAWLIRHHENLVKLARSGKGLDFSIQDEANQMQQVFLSLLLQGDTQGSAKLAEDSIHNEDDLKHFYLDVVWPSMVRIGELWEADQITVAEEHLATAIVSRIMANLYPRFAQFKISRGKAVISAGPNEFHEIGARMLADFMELDGWDVTYLGANIPAHEMISVLKREKPFLIALSVATVFNIQKSGFMLKNFKDDQETRHIKVLLGGHAFSELPQFWENLGADGYAPDAERGLNVANDWWNSRNL